jgi:hypothetical protein
MTEVIGSQSWIKSNSLIEKLDQIECYLKEEEENKCKNTKLGKRKRTSNSNKILNNNKYSLKIIKALNNNIDLPTLAKMYLKDTKYDKDFYSSSCGAIFYAYLQYLKNIKISYDYANHIYYRNAILLHNKDIVITVDRLIEEYDGNDSFTTYLKNILDKKK